MLQGTRSPSGITQEVLDTLLLARLMPSQSRGSVAPIVALYVQVYHDDDSMFVLIIKK
jgi:hypothetical protein